jgi:hypothetical protein
MGGLATGPPSPPDARDAAAKPWRPSKYSDRLLALRRGSARNVTFEPGTRSLPSYRLALIAGVLCFGTVLVLNLPGVADVRRYRSLASVFSHLALALIAFGLSPRFRGWVKRAAALSSGRQVLYLIYALAGPLLVMITVLAVAPSYGHELFTREWGIVEPLQFVLWLTAAWLAFERARYAGRGTADGRVFRLGAWVCILLAIEEVDYLGIVSLVARVAGVPGGRIGGHHLGGLHDIVNELGKTSLLLGLFSIGLVVVLVLMWCVSRGLHRVVIREMLSPTSWPLVGTVAFMAIAQLADIDHPVLRVLLGDVIVVQKLREEPMELLSVICANASLIAKLTPFLRRPGDIAARWTAARPPSHQSP